MPAAPRSNSKAKKISEKLIGKPTNQQTGKKKPKKKGY